MEQVLEKPLPQNNNDTFVLEVSNIVRGLEYSMPHMLAVFLLQMGLPIPV